MAIKLFGGRVRIGKDLGQYAGRADDFYAIMQQRYGVDYHVRNRLEAYKNVVYDCVSLIAEACGDYQPVLEKKIGDQWKVTEHEFLRLLARPAGRELKASSFTQFDLFEATISYMLLQGDCFWYMANGKSSGRPREIVVLRPDKVGTDIDKKTGEVTGYFIRRSVGDPIPLEINEVLRFSLFNPKDPYKGYGVVESNSDYIETDESTAEFTKNFFKNNAGLSGVLNIKGEVTKGAFRKFVRAWREKYEGVGNAGKVAIVRDSDASFEKVGLGLDELDMGALRKMSLHDVFMAFKVPPELLGQLSDGAGLGRANLEVLEYIFSKYNIDKKLKRFDGVLQFALERYYGLTNDQYRMVHENIIPEDKEFELKERVASVDIWKTRNEIRGEEEDGNDITGGDQLFVPAMQIPINEASTSTPPAKSAGIVATVTRTVKKKDSSRGIGKEAAERFRLTLMRNQLRYERQYKKTVKPIFKDQRKEALTNLEAHAGALAKAQGQKLFDDAAYDARMVSDITPMLTELTKTQGGLALVFAGDDENEFHVTSKIVAKLQRGTKKMATHFNDETLERLNVTLAEGIQAGEGLGELKKRVNEVYDNVDGFRSERIARTETLKASNSASVDAYRQTGYVTAKAWAINPDACPECQEFDGKTIPLDDSFLGLGESYTTTDDEGNETVHTNDYDTIEEPPLHPNCRCTIIPVR